MTEVGTMNHIVIPTAADCSGCTACASICTHDAIRMEADALGFLYPQLDETKCINCGLCAHVCAFHPNYDRSLNLVHPIVYGGRHKDERNVMQSRSGAAFVAISDYVLEHGGVVYGVGFADHFRVVHKRAVNKQERDELRGSKYVQSDLTGIFSEVKTDLQNGQQVLFTGTPCQTAGLNAFIGKKLRTNLLLVDVVCHGAPSPYLWRDYLDYVEKKEGEPAKGVNFRDKELFGWDAHQETFTFGSKRGGSDRKKAYSIRYYSNLVTRKSCANCHFANIVRPSDITLADFWGVERVNPDANKDNKGVSLILCNTEKGRDLFDRAKAEMDIFPVLTEDYMQLNLRQPTEAHPHRNEFEAFYAQHGFAQTMRHYNLMGWRYSLDRWLTLQKIRIHSMLSGLRSRIIGHNSSEHN